MSSEQILALMIRERDKLNRPIEALGGEAPKRRGRPPVIAAGVASPAKRKLSAAGRKAIADAARKRLALIWALIKAVELQRRLGGGKQHSSGKNAQEAPYQLQTKQIPEGRKTG